jgi:hypothetical protein
MYVCMYKNLIELLLLLPTLFIVFHFLMITLTCVDGIIVVIIIIIIIIILIALFFLFSLYVYFFFFFTCADFVIGL